MVVEEELNLHKQHCHRLPFPFAPLLQAKTSETAVAVAVVVAAAAAGVVVVGVGC